MGIYRMIMTSLKSFFSSPSFFFLLLPSSSPSSFRAMATFQFTKDSPDEQLYSDIGSLNSYEMEVLNELAAIVFGFLTQQNQVSS